jgi:hypothetical protein
MVRALLQFERNEMGHLSCSGSEYGAKREGTKAGDFRGEGFGGALDQSHLDRLDQV